MADRPEPLKQLDLHFLAARIAHEYADDLHYELAELHADDAHTRKLLSDSANVIPTSWPSCTPTMPTRGSCSATRRT